MPGRGRGCRASLGAATLVAGLLATACANIEPPSGGPEDRAAPDLVALRPDSLAVLTDRDAAVVFEFDERISERGVNDAVLVSPRTSPVEVSHGGGNIRVRLRRGWEPGQIYQVTLLPGLQDLFGNRTAEPRTLIFSTGPEIPDTRLAGTVIDRITGRPDAGARVEAIRAADSLVYTLPADSAGRFAFRRIPAGTYQLRALRDLNRNRALDDFEPRDTAAAVVAVGVSPSVRLSLVAPDSTAPVPASARVAGGTVELLFDDYLDPAQRVVPSQVRIVGPGGALVAVTRVAVGRLPRADSAAAPADTPRATPADTARPAPGTSPQPAPRDTALAGVPVDTAIALVAELPSQTLVVETAAPLVAGAEYRVTVSGVRNLVGLVGGGEVTLTPEAAPAERPANTPSPPATPPPAADTVPGRRS